MTWRNASERYGRISIVLHRLMLLLFIAVNACIELRELYPNGSDPREALKMWHFMLGLLVFVLEFIRLAARRSGPPIPRIEPAPPQWQKRVAALVHVALYGLMIGMPLLGWCVLSAEGKPTPFLV